MLRALDDVHRERHRDVASWCGSAGRYRVRVVRTGIGAERAAVAAARLVDNGPLPRWVVSTGCAGALDAGLAAGDLVVATAIVTDTGPVAGPSARDAAAVATWARSRGINLRLGSFYSARDPLLDGVAKRAARRRTGAILVEMEGAAAAAAAVACGGRCVAVRAILDPVDAALPAVLAPQAARQGLVRLATDVAPAAVSRLAMLVAGQRAARRALGVFFAAFFQDGRGLAALEHAAGSAEPPPS